MCLNVPDEGIRVADGKGFLKVVDGLYERAKKFPHREEIVEFGMMAGLLPALQRIFPYTPKKIQTLTNHYGPSVDQRFKKARRACPSCFVADKDILEVKETCGKVHITYPTGFGLAPFLCRYLAELVPEQILKIFDQLNRQGLDLFTFGKMVDLLVNAYEEGLIGEKQTRGLLPERTSEFFLRLIDMISRGEGIGTSWPKDGIKPWKPSGKPSGIEPS